MTTPLDKSWNVAVLHMASITNPNGFDVSEQAPGSYKELCEHMSATGRMLVWNGASTQTVFDDHEVNWAGRAWHDWTHYTYHHEFTISGERAVCEQQKRDVVHIYGQSAQTSYWLRLLEAEIMGQVIYKEAYGEFTVDQRAFVELHLEDPATANEQYRKTMS